MGLDLRYRLAEKPPILFCRGLSGSHSGVRFQNKSDIGYIRQVSDIYFSREGSSAWIDDNQAFHFESLYGLSQGSPTDLEFARESDVINRLAGRKG
jgi:hypothetical protein